MMSEQSLLGKRDNRVPGAYWPWETKSQRKTLAQKPKQVQGKWLKKKYPRLTAGPHTHIHNAHEHLHMPWPMYTHSHPFMYTHIHKICKNHLGDSSRRMVSSRATWAVQQDQRGNGREKTRREVRKEGGPHACDLWAVSQPKAHPPQENLLWTSETGC